MRTVKNTTKPVREGLDNPKNETRVLRALWRVLASRRAAEQSAQAVEPKGDDDGDDLEWHLRMMS